MPNQLFIYVEWPLSEQWRAIAEKDYEFYSEMYGNNLCSDYDNNLGVYVNKQLYDSFV